MEIYVGNLPWSVTDQELADAFGAYGNVEKASIISDRHSGRSKGFGFVTMNDADEAEQSDRNDEWQKMGGRGLKVNEARPREDRPPGNPIGKLYPYHSLSSPPLARTFFRCFDRSKNLLV